MPRHRQVIISIATRVVVSAVLVLVAIGTAMLLAQTREVPEQVSGDDRLARILVMGARPISIARQWEGFGTAQARFAANVPAQVRGLIVNVPRDIVAGARVEAGQLIAQIDTTDFVDEIEVTEQRIAEVASQIAQLDVERQRSLEQLELLQEEVAIARADVQRLEGAHEQAGATQREVDQARQTLSAAIRAEVAAREQVERIEPRRAQLQATLRGQQTALRIAQRNLQRTTITSPFAGYLQSVNVEQGETIGVDQPVARVVQLDRIEVALRVPASARPDLFVGGQVLLEGTGTRQRKWSAHIERIAPVEDEQTRTVTVYVEVEQVPRGLAENDGEHGELLFPGQFVRGLVTSPIAEQRWVVPRRAVQSDRIRIVDNGVIDSRPVLVDFQIQQELPQTGLADTQWAVLAEPLRHGTLVVVDGGRPLSEGMQVQPVPAGGPAGTPSQRQEAPE